MIIVLRPHVSDDEVARVVDQVRQLGLTPHVSRGVTRTIIGCIGDEDRMREFPLLAFPAVETAGAMRVAARACCSRANAALMF